MTVRTVISRRRPSTRPCFFLPPALQKAKGPVDLSNQPFDLLLACLIAYGDEQGQLLFVTSLSVIVHGNAEGGICNDPVPLF